MIVCTVNCVLKSSDRVQSTFILAFKEEVSNGDKMVVDMI